MNRLQTVILAAGFGTRMKSHLPKVVHKIMGKPLVTHVIDTTRNADIADACVIVGHMADVVQEAITRDNVTYRYQKEMLGTGHAVMMAEDFIDPESTVVILCGDTPLITSDSLKELITFHEEEGNSATVLSAHIDNPTGYGRIVRNVDEEFLKIVEQKDATEEEKAITEINSGMYCFKGADLLSALKQVGNDNASGEYYLPDTLYILLKEGKKVNAMSTDSFDDTRGINNRVQLHEAEKIMQKRLNEKWMMEGVTFIDSATTSIGCDVTIGMDTVIYPNVIIEGNTTIGENCVIGPNSRINDCQIGNYVKVESSTLMDSSIGDSTTVGPYAYVRPGCNIGKEVKIGDFVEIKNANIGDYTKASHLTYIGDADVGEHVNFGCGTVVVNYDGVNKHRSTIKDHAFIGCNSNLVSPVLIEESAYTGAGSTITKTVPSGSLAVARAKQVNIPNWVDKNRKK